MTATLEDILPPTAPCIGCGEPTAAYNGHGQPQCFHCFTDTLFAELEEDADWYSRKER